MKESGKLPYIEPGQVRDFEVAIELFDSQETFDSMF